MSFPPNGLLLPSFKIVLPFAPLGVAQNSFSFRVSPTLLPLDGDFPRRQRRQKDDVKDDSKTILLLVRDISAQREEEKEGHTKPHHHRHEHKINEEKRTSFLRARERPSLVPVLVVLELRPAFHDHAAEARVDARGCFRLDVVRGRRHDDDDVFGSRIVVRFLKWLNNMLTVDDEDHTLTFYVFRVLLSFFFAMIFFLIFFWVEQKRRTIIFT